MDNDRNMRLGMLSKINGNMRDKKWYHQQRLARCVAPTQSNETQDEPGFGNFLDLAVRWSANDPVGFSADFAILVFPSFGFQGFCLSVGKERPRTAQRGLKWAEVGVLCHNGEACGRSGT